MFLDLGLRSVDSGEAVERFFNGDREINFVDEARCDHAKWREHRRRRSGSLVRAAPKTLHPGRVVGGLARQALELRAGMIWTAISKF